MATMKIKKGDTVKVIAGKYKDKEGKVLSVDHKAKRVTVEGVGMVTKHEKPSQSNPNGGRITVEAPIDISNVMYVHKGKTVRVGFKVEETGGKVKKSRIAKPSGDVIDVVYEKSAKGGK